MEPQRQRVVGRADDNRVDRRVTETENGRDSDVAADNEPRPTTEAMHRKDEGPYIKLTNNSNDRDAQTKKKTTNVANRTEGVQNNNIDTDTERSIKHKTRKRVRPDCVSNHYGDKGQVGDMYGKR